DRSVIPNPRMKGERRQCCIFRPLRKMYIQVITPIPNQRIKVKRRECWIFRLVRKMYIQL
ncbi:hypothetical protein NDU88_007103, partial [Pleurodeles waltl]